MTKIVGKPIYSSNIVLYLNENMIFVPVKWCVSILILYSTLLISANVA